MKDQWVEDIRQPGQASNSGRTTTTENPRRVRDNFQGFQPSGISPPSKSQKPNNDFEEEIQNARANLRSTSSRETSPLQASNRALSFNSPTPGQTSPRAMDTSLNGSGEHVADEIKEVTITSNQGQNFGRISAVRVSRALRDLVSAYSFKVTSITTIRVSVSVRLLQNLVGIEMFCGIPVEVAVSTTTGPREYTWGKFYSQDLFYSSDQEIFEELQEENDDIIFVERLYRGREKIPTRLIKVKFQTTRRPDYVYCLGSAYEITEYLPPVKRCFSCHSYSHFTSDCKNAAKCRNCNLVHPEAENCTNEARCAHCGPGHTSDDPTCPKYIKKREIVAISFEKNVPYQTARNNVAEGEISYASKLKLKNELTKTKNSNSDQTTAATNNTGATKIVETKDSSTGRTDSNTRMEREIDETLEKPDAEQSEQDKVMYGKITKKLPAWMVLVSEMTKALTSTSNLEDFRNSFSSIIEDIENEIDSNRSTSLSQSQQDGS